MPFFRTRSCRYGNGEAIRLPQEVAFGDGTELIVVRSGDVMTIYPAATSIADMTERLHRLPAPPTIDQRDKEDLLE
jgi:antitoxin VapB